jgi:two-component system nitrate/nitrite response regulator NarL
MRQQKSYSAILIGKRSLLSEGVARILRSAHFRIDASVSCAEDLIGGEVHSQQSLFLVIHTCDDFDVTARQIELLRSTCRDARIAVVADRYPLDDLVSAFRAGANAYFSELTTSDVFIKSIELVMMGETVIPPALLSFVADPENGRLDDSRLDDICLGDDKHEILLTRQSGVDPQFSPREKLILGCLIDGDSNKSIARKVEISEATVKVHVKAILRKIRVHNRTQAAIWGMNNGWFARTSSSSSPSLMPDIDKQLPTPTGINHELEQSDGSTITKDKSSNLRFPRRK